MITQQVIPRILSQHAEEASFLWVLREIAIHAPHYSLKDLARLDARIEANLEGLVVAGPEGWRVCVEELRWAEPGEVFAASAVAFLSGDLERIQPVLEAIRTDPSLARGMISALGFVPDETVRNRIRQLAAANSYDMQRLGIAASAIRRLDPGPTLAKCIGSDDANLRARSCRAVGELARRDLLPPLRALLEHTHEETRFWSAWSIGILGDRNVFELIKEFVTPDGVRATRAIQLAARLIDLSTANVWRSTLAKSENSLRHAIVAAGAIGDPSAVMWLIELMDSEKFARVAGEAFTAITGADLAFLDLEKSVPVDSDAGPSDDPADPNVSLDPDEDLPWPDRALVAKWWTQNSAKFAIGRRYLLGRPIDNDSLQIALREGRQRHRAAAAIELMLSNPTSPLPLFEVRANARVQSRQLAV